MVSRYILHEEKKKALAAGHSGETRSSSIPAEQVGPLAIDGISPAVRPVAPASPISLYYFKTVIGRIAHLGQMFGLKPAVRGHALQVIEAQVRQSWLSVCCMKAGVQRLADGRDPQWPDRLRHLYLSRFDPRL